MSFSRKKSEDIALTKWTSASLQKEHSENKKRLLEMKDLAQKCKSSTQGIESKETFKRAEQEDRERK